MHNQDVVQVLLTYRDHEVRSFHYADIKADPITDHFNGFLLDKRYLIHDRDSKLTAAFDPYMRDNEVKSVVLPPKSPN